MILLTLFFCMEFIILLLILFRLKDEIIHYNIRKTYFKDLEIRRKQQLEESEEYYRKLNEQNDLKLIKKGKK